MSATEIPVGVAVSRTDAEVVVFLTGELDLSTRPMIEPVLVDLVHGQGNLSLTLDLAQVTFLDSTALSLFVTVHGDLRSRGGTLTLRNASPATRRLFEITGIDRTIAVESS